MDLMLAFEEMCKDYGKFSAALKSASKNIAEPEMQAYLRELTGQMEQAFAEVQREVPGALQTLTSGMDEAKKDVEKTKQDIEASRVKLEALQKQVEAGFEMPEPPKPEPEPTDKELDALFGMLRGELLDRFGDASQKETTGQVLENREAWEDWTAFGHPKERGK